MLALQFHLEMRGANIKNIIKNCKNELDPGEYIQDEKSIIAGTKYNLNNANSVMIKILERIDEWHTHSGESFKKFLI